MKTSEIKQNSKIGSEIIKIDAFARADEALTLMKTHAIHHLAVFEKGEFRGVISDRDLLHSPSIDSVNQILKYPPVIIDQNSDVSQVLTLMVEQGVDAIGIMKNGELSGLVTKTDMLRVLHKVHQESGVQNLVSQGETLLSNPMVQNFLNALSSLGV